MSQEFLQSKWKKMINFFDFDGDGFLSKEDAVSFADQFCAHFKGTQAQKDHFRETFYKIYDGVLLMDKDGDKKVTDWEVYEFLNEMIKNNTTEAVVGAFVTVAMQVIDTNGDGKISKQEYIDYMNLNPRKVVSDPEGCFGSLDLNGDGFITIDELHIVFRDFYTSTDPKAKGNVLYGK
eukprot:TRINITY_DN436_c0_g1_i1.p1 TRINITY_DN436_c0_g1~~TRINITY_DN436_c0_g1_i1.p1  ORF type:complete len:178 (-),score=42.47 TRINITY_DN436_c0_g1_i1:56-589(-)